LSTAMVAKFGQKEPLKKEPRSFSQLQVEVS